MRIVAKPAPPSDPPAESDETEERERVPPGRDTEERDHQWLGHRAREGAGHDREAEHAAALGARQPARVDPRHRGERARLAEAEEQAHDQQRRESDGKPGRGRHQRPPDDDARERDAGAEAVRHPAARHLEERVREGEGAEHEPHLRVAQAELGAHRRRRRRDADAIEVRDRDQRERERDDAMTRARRRAGERRGPALGGEHPTPAGERAGCRTGRPTPPRRPDGASSGRSVRSASRAGSPRTVPRSRAARARGARGTGSTRAT